MEKNRVVKKILYYIDVECASPICVSNGEEHFHLRFISCGGDEKLSGVAEGSGVSVWIFL